jgi:hypothetical protein
MTKVFKFPEVLFKNPEVFEVLGGFWTDFRRGSQVGKHYGTLANEEDAPGVHPYLSSSEASGGRDIYSIYYLIYFFLNLLVPRILLSSGMQPAENTRIFLKKSGRNAFLILKNYVTSQQN